MQQRDKIKILRDIAHDIIHFNDKRKQLTFNAATNIFYDIMRKHGVKEGEKSKTGKGIIVQNPEWVMCWHLFESMHLGHWQMDSLINAVPKDLAYYPVKQNRNKLK